MKRPEDWYYLLLYTSRFIVDLLFRPLREAECSGPLSLSVVPTYGALPQRKVFHWSWPFFCYSVLLLAFRRGRIRRTSSPLGR